MAALIAKNVGDEKPLLLRLTPLFLKDKPMYCINCGVELSNGQAVCPICHTPVVHPDFLPNPELFPYPAKPFHSEACNHRGLLFVVTILAALLMGMPLLMEVLLSRPIIWSGYVAGGVFLGYCFFLLPLWFRNPNPTVLSPATLGSSPCICCTSACIPAEAGFYPLHFLSP